MRRTRRIRWNLRALAVGFAAAAAFNGAASAGEMPLGYAPEIEDELAMIEQSRGSVTSRGGVTPTNLARAYVERYDGVAAPDGFQPQLSGNQPLVIRSAPDGSQPQLHRTADTSVPVADDGRRFDRADVAIGLSLALALIGALGLAVAMTRGRVRLAH